MANEGRTGAAQPVGTPCTAQPQDAPCEQQLHGWWVRIWGEKSKTKGKFSSYLPRKREDIFQHFSGRIWSDLKIVVTTNTLRWARGGIPWQAELLCLVRSWQSQLDVLQLLGRAAQGGGTTSRAQMSSERFHLLIPIG